MTQRALTRKPLCLEAHGLKPPDGATGPPAAVADDENAQSRGVHAAHCLNGSGIGHTAVVKDAELVQQNAFVAVSYLRDAGDALRRRCGHRRAR